MRTAVQDMSRMIEATMRARYHYANQAPQLVLTNEITPLYM
jgi:hypothetical protein